MNFTEAQEQEQKNRKEQMATKYSDEEIKEQIGYALTAGYDAAIACANTAQAMIAYNEMINRRWGK
jgi:ribulose bisphosphate carboxylase small subunit